MEHKLMAVESTLPALGVRRRRAAHGVGGPAVVPRRRRGGGGGLVPARRHDAAVADAHAHGLAADEAQLVGQLVHDYSGRRRSSSSRRSGCSAGVMFHRRRRPTLRIQLPRGEGKLAESHLREEEEEDEGVCRPQCRPRSRALAVCLVVRTSRRRTFFSSGPDLK